MVTVAEVDDLITSGEVKWEVTLKHWQTNEEYQRTRTVESWEDAKYELREDGVDTRLGRLARVAEYGGMDLGSDYWVVVSLTNADGNVQYFRKSGWYASHDGGYLDNETEEVFPYEKTVTEFRSA
jgi:hypothetical protein